MRNGWKLQKVAIFRRSKALLQDDDLPSVVFTLKLPLHAHETAACFSGVREYVGLIQQQHDTRIHYSQRCHVAFWYLLQQQE